MILIFTFFYYNKSISFFRVLSERKLSEFPSLMEFCVELYSKHIRSPFLMACMIDNYEEMLEQGKPKKEENLQNATQVRHTF